MDRFRLIFRTIKSRFKGAAIWLATGALISVATVVYVSAPNAVEAANFGNYLAGVASAIALLWLVAAYRLQGSELRLQREELHLQRIAIEQQARELSNSARLASLAQIQDLLEQARASVCTAGLNLSHPSEISTKFMHGMQAWNSILESRSAQDVQQNYFDWMKIEACARSYVRDVCTAMKLYFEFHAPTATVDNSKPPEEFVCIYQSWVYSAPYISAHIGSAAMLANFLFMFKPGLDAIQLGGLTASAKLLRGDIVKKDGMEKLRKEVVDRGLDLPKICEPWPFAA